MLYKTICNDEESIYLFRGMILREDHIDLIDRILSGLIDKIAKLERNTPTPEGTQLNTLECSLGSLLKAQGMTNIIVEGLRNDVHALSRRLYLNTLSHMRMSKAIDKNSSVIEKIAAILAQEIRATKKREKRISDIEEFLGDL